MVLGLLTQCFEILCVFWHFVLCLTHFDFLKVYSVVPGLFFLVLLIVFFPVFRPFESPSVCLCLYSFVSPCALFPQLCVLFHLFPSHHVCALPLVPSVPLACFSSTPASCFLFYCGSLMYQCALSSVLLPLFHYGHSSFDLIRRAVYFINH